MASAKAYAERNDLRAAGIELRNAVQKDPRSGEVRLLFGEVLLREGNTVAAAVELQRAVDFGVEPARVLPALARAWLAEGKPQQVIDKLGAQTFDDATATADLQTSLATAYFIGQQNEKAESALAAAEGAKAGYPAALVLRARMQAARGQTDESMALIERVIAESPRYADAYYAKGHLVWHVQGQTESAGAAFRKAIELEPYHAPARSALISLMLATKDVKGAETEIEQLRKLPGQSLTVMLFQSQMAIAQGNKTKAYELVQQTLKLLPDYPLALQTAGGLELDAGRLTEAERSLNKALQLAPDLPVARRLLATVYLRAGSPDKALAALMPLITSPLPDAANLLLAGEAYLQLNEPVKAESVFQRAAKMDPKDTRSRTALALSRLQARSDERGQSLADLTSIAAADTQGSDVDLALVSYYVNKRDAANALAAIERLEAKKLGTPMVAHLRGVVEGLRNDRVKARAAFEHAVEIDRVYMPAVKQLVAMDVVEGKYDAAQKRFERVLAVDRKNPAALAGLASIRAANGAPAAEVESLLRETIAGNPQNAAAHGALVNHLLSSNQPRHALQAAQQALVALPDNADLLDGLGRSQAAIGENNQAETTLKRAIVLSPRAPTPHIHLAELQLAANQVAEAKASYQRALRLAPTLVSVQDALLKLAMRERQPAQALEIAKTVQKQYPSLPLGFMWQADVQAAELGPKASIPIYRELFDRFATTQLLVRLHGALVAAGQGTEAKKLADSWQSSHPDDIELREYLGESALRTRDYASAAEYFKWVVERRPGNVAALNNLSWVLVKQRQPGAVDYALRANAIRPDSAPMLDTLSTALAADKQFSKAIETQKRAVALAPNEPGLKLSLARIYEQAGQSQAARTELQALAALGDKFPAQAEVKAMLSRL